jgi:hypothetical protein
MHRRDLLRTLAASALAAALPGSLRAQEVWAEALVLPTAPPRIGVLSPAERALVHAIADVILPRTDTPSASDVQVVEFVDVIAERYYEAAERDTFLEGLRAIEALAQRTANRALVDMSAADREALVGRLDAASPRSTPAERAFGRLKGLVIHAYFTSERVQREVLRTEVMPGRFVGDAPHVVPALPGSDNEHATTGGTDAHAA